ncbi:MAG: acyl transferase, partial [Bacteroidota bacterium]
MNYPELVKAIEQVEATTFDALALAIFRYQAQQNPTYKRFIELLSVDITKVHTIEQIPFLPIECFKNFEVKTGESPPL